MRLLLTFLFSVVIHYFVVLTKDNGGNTFAHKSYVKIVQSKNIDPIVTIQKAKKLVKIQASQISQLIHQHHFQHINLARYTIFSKTTSLKNPLKLIKQLKNKIDFSYQYIFKCLYPKYSFW